MKKTTRVFALLLSALMLFGMLAGCKAPAATTSESVGSASESAASGSGESKYAGRTLKILLSVGGAGNYYEPVAERMMETYPGLTVEIDYNSAAADVLRTEILSGDAPDIWNINSVQLPPYDAIDQGIAMPIDEIFEEKTMDGSATLADITDPSLFTLGEVDGKHYLMFDMMYLNGLWYDANFFETNHLTVPTNWDELMQLGEQCKALGMDLFGYSGLLASEYAANYWFWPMVATTDYNTYVDIQNLDETAFKSAGMQKIVEKMVAIRDQGYYDKNTMGLGNSETQMAFINHDFALLPCGSWLEAEMADAWTDEWKLAYLPYSFGTNAGDTQYMFTECLFSMVSATTKNLDLVKEFYRFLFSDHDSIFNSVSIHQNPVDINGFSDNYGELLLPSVNDASQALNKMTTINTPVYWWYSAFNTEIGNMINALMSGDIDGDAFMQRGCDLITGIKSDNTIVKHEFNG